MFNSRNNTRECLLRAISVYSFMAYEAMLYLDAYPDCKEAIDCYNKYKRLENRTVMEYESKFGPLTAPNEASSWEWTNGPWPWQTEKEGR